MQFFEHSSRGPRSRRSSIVDAIERATQFLIEQRLPERRAADGRVVGIQATLAMAKGDGLELYSLLDGMVGHADSDESKVFAGDPAADLWRDIRGMVERKLGFPLEPELFSNMLFVAAVGASDEPALRHICRALLPAFQRSDADGLFHFFTSLRFACDLDCTGMAARALLTAGAIDPQTPVGAATLRRITSRILKSAATCDVSREANASHGKDNGPLRRLVIKVYPDDHEVQGPECDRGLKNNPVVATNALYPLLVELKLGLRDPFELVLLKEYAHGEVEPRTSFATVKEIVAENIRYVAGYLLSGDWRSGCRYYASPDAFLCFFSECLSEFPELFAAFDAINVMRLALLERRGVVDEDAALDPGSSLNCAFRAIAADNVGLDNSFEVDRLLASQAADGSWNGRDALYTFGAATPVYFRSVAVTTGFAIRALAPTPRPSPSSVDWTAPILDEMLKSLLPSDPHD